MEKLAYSIDDSTIAQILGRDNFTNEYSAILELVKNSYDACAKEVTILFNTKNEKSITITDDGHGMSEDDIRINWMHVGKSLKKYIISDSEDKRIYSGSKGIGRFSLARLGAKVEIISKKSDFNAVKLISDWNETLIDIDDNEICVGTKILVSGLNDRWSEANIKSLAYFLSCSCNSDKMKINIIYNDKCIQVERIFDNVKKGINYVSKINLNYNCNELKLFINIDSDEFLDNVQDKISNANIKNQAYILDIKNEIRKSNLSEEENFQKREIFRSVGDFSGELYFSLSSITTDDAEKFKYKYKNLDSRLVSNMILYRNAFSISSYDGKKDWLDLNQRSRKSPAAASHETGSWRVRSNQLSGSILIDKKENELLKDLSNRQGLAENEQYDAFKQIIHFGLEKFEDYRQGIIRKIAKENKDTNNSNLKIYEKFLKNPETFDNLTSKEKLRFVSEIKELVKISDDRVYDVRILNVLATSGLKATSIAHELNNKRNNIESNYENIIDSFKVYKLWEFLNKPENIREKHRNIPGMLSENNDISQKIITFMDVLLSETEKSNFKPAEVNIYKYISALSRKWEADYKGIKINIIGENNKKILLFKDSINVIFDNLILNSIQQNQNGVNIVIEYSIDFDNISFYYKDNGVGLNEKYLDEPYRILKVHETTRDGGHGLGMWIVNNTILSTEGKINKIYSKEGFGFDFSIGVKNVG